MPIVFQNGKIVIHNSKIVMDCNCCEESEPDLYDSTKWYCVRVRQYGPGSNCTGTPSDTNACMSGADIAMYGWWDTCFDYGSGCVNLTYISGPYDTSACGGNC